MNPTKPPKPPRPPSAWQLEQARRQPVMDQTKQLLAQRKFQDALKVPANYFRQSKNDLSVSLPPNQEIQFLKIIFDYRPPWLQAVPPAQQEELRLAAALSHLWGENTDRFVAPDAAAIGKWDAATAARQLLFYALHRIDLERMLKSEVVSGVEILATKDSCPACRQLARKKYPLKNAPLLPHPGCTHPLGCRCTYTAIIK